MEPPVVVVPVVTAAAMVATAEVAAQAQGPPQVAKRASSGSGLFSPPATSSKMPPPGTIVTKALSSTSSPLVTPRDSPAQTPSAGSVAVAAVAAAASASSAAGLMPAPASAPAHHVAAASAAAVADADGADRRLSFSAALSSPKAAASVPPAEFKSPAAKLVGPRGGAHLVEASPGAQKLADALVAAKQTSALIPPSPVQAVASAMPGLQLAPKRAAAAHGEHSKDADFMSTVEDEGEGANGSSGDDGSPSQLVDKRAPLPLLQRTQLEAAFRLHGKHIYREQGTVVALSTALNLEVRKVKKWFDNRLQSDRKRHMHFKICTACRAAVEGSHASFHTVPLGQSACTVSPAATEAEYDSVMASGGLAGMLPSKPSQFAPAQQQQQQQRMMMSQPSSQPTEPVQASSSSASSQDSSADKEDYVRGSKVILSDGRRGIVNGASNGFFKVTLNNRQLVNVRRKEITLDGGGAFNDADADADAVAQEQSQLSMRRHLATHLSSSSRPRPSFGAPQRGKPQQHRPSRIRQELDSFDIFSAAADKLNRTGLISPEHTDGTSSSAAAAAAAASSDTSDPETDEEPQTHFPGSIDDTPRAKLEHWKSEQRIKNGPDQSPSVMLKTLLPDESREDSDDEFDMYSEDEEAMNSAALDFPMESAPKPRTLRPSLSSQPASECIGKIVQTKDLRRGEVLTAGNGFYKLMMDDGDSFFARRKEFTIIEDGEGGGGGRVAERPVTRAPTEQDRAAVIDIIEEYSNHPVYEDHRYTGRRIKSEREFGWAVAYRPDKRQFLIHFDDGTEGWERIGMNVRLLKARIEDDSANDNGDESEREQADEETVRKQMTQRVGRSKASSSGPGFQVPTSDVVGRMVIFCNGGTKGVVQSSGNGFLRVSVTGKVEPVFARRKEVELDAADSMYAKYKGGGKGGGDGGGGGSNKREAASDAGSNKKMRLEYPASSSSSEKAGNGHRRDVQVGDDLSSIPTANCVGAQVAAKDGRTGQVTGCGNGFLYVAMDDGFEPPLMSARRKDVTLVSSVECTISEEQAEGMKQEELHKALKDLTGQGRICGKSAGNETVAEMKDRLVQFVQRCNAAQQQMQQAPPESSAGSLRSRSARSSSAKSKGKSSSSNSDLIGKAVTLKDGRRGTVESSGNGFLEIRTSSGVTTHVRRKAIAIDEEEAAYMAVEEKQQEPAESGTREQRAAHKQAEDPAQPSENDAIEYLRVIQEKFHQTPQVYTQFLAIANDLKQRFESDSFSDTHEVIQRAVQLFEGHDDLIVRFNVFLPAAYKIDNEKLEGYKAALAAARQAEEGAADQAPAAAAAKPAGRHSRAAQQAAASAAELPPSPGGDMQVE